MSNELNVAHYKDAARTLDYLAARKVDDPDWEASERVNREALVTLLRSSGEKTVELYGIWDGEFVKPVNVREEIPLTRIVEPDFRFKERGFYTVSL